MKGGTLLIFTYWGSLIILIPGIIFTIWAQMKVRSSFSRYSQVQSSIGTTGAKAARYLLDQSGLHSIPVEQVAGQMTDHYDPRKQAVRLSQSTFNKSSVAALGIVAHEIGHVLQQKDGYFPFLLRSALVPVAQFGSNFAWIVFFGGLIASMPIMINIGIWLFVAVVLFSIITLPVEFNASSRALHLMETSLLMATDEKKMTKQVLNAAALTYLAGTLMAILNLVRMIAIARD